MAKILFFEKRRKELRQDVVAVTVRLKGIEE